MTTTHTTTPRPIQVPFMLYTLSAEPDTMGSPAEPAVDLFEKDMRGRVLHTHAVTPAQARELAAQLVKAADVSESRGQDARLVESFGGAR
ncbi:hypothetical protein ACQP60_04340 [Isoptericola variabilis]|uniref:hypothetical protein n=1 Tax=Isoptericola variabilis TaxID=139208 RepID=UPI003D241C2F